MRENRPYGSEGGASQTNGTSLPPIVGGTASGFLTEWKNRNVSETEYKIWLLELFCLEQPIFKLKSAEELACQTVFAALLFCCPTSETPSKKRSSLESRWFCSVEPAGQSAHDSAQKSTTVTSILFEQEFQRTQ